MSNPSSSGWSARAYAVVRTLAGAWCAWFLIASGHWVLAIPAIFMVIGWRAVEMAFPTVFAFVYGTAHFDLLWRASMGWHVLSFGLAKHRLPAWAYSINWVALTVFWVAPLLVGMRDAWAWAPVALLVGCAWRPARPWAWTALVVLAVFRSTDALSGAGALLLHLAAWDPRWVSAVVADGEETMYYDGTCGLCHRGVQFVAAEVPTNSTTLFAPLHGDHFKARDWPSELPDSVIFRDADDRVHVRSRGAIEIARRMGGLWRVLATALAVIPRPILDALYDGVAATRQKLFAKPKDVCPMLPPESRTRFRE